LRVLVVLCNSGAALGVGLAFGMKAVFEWARAGFPIIALAEMLPIDVDAS